MTETNTHQIVLAPPERRGLFMLAKRVVQAFFLIRVSPRLLAYYVAKRILGRRALTSSSESLARVPGLRGVYLRQAFYRFALAACGRDVYIGWQSVFSMPEARLGERAFVGRFCTIGYADIGEEVMIADGVQILSGGHEHGHSSASDVTMHEQPQTYRMVQIGRGAWIGAGVIVMNDIGEGSIVGAGAVVSRPIPARSVAVGVPARVVKSLDSSAGNNSGNASDMG